MRKIQLLRQVSAPTFCRERPPWCSVICESTSTHLSRNATEGVPYRRQGSFACAIVAVLCTALRAQERAITVMGSGEALAKPDVMEIELHAAGESELMADATTKYEGAVRRITGAVNKLEIEGLTIEPRGIRISDQAADDDEERMVFGAGGGRQAAAKAHTGISRSLRVVVPKINALSEAEVIASLAKLLDAAKDAGAAIGPPRRNNYYMVTADGEQLQPSVVTFVVADPAAAREEAYRKAFADATQRATRLATLAGAKIGNVLSAEEADAEHVVYYPGRGTSRGESRLVSSTLEDIPVRAVLRVRFALEEKVDSK